MMPLLLFLMLLVLLLLSFSVSFSFSFSVMFWLGRRDDGRDDPRFLSLSGSARLGRQTGTFGACRRRPWLNRILQVTNDVGTTLVVVVAVAHTPS